MPKTRRLTASLRKEQMRLTAPLRKEQIIPVPPGGRPWDRNPHGLSWKSVVERYREQMAGQQPAWKKMCRDLAVKRTEFDMLASAVTQHSAGTPFEDIADNLGKDKVTICNWVVRGKSPRSISALVHERNQRKRTPLSVDFSDHSSAGYFLGILAAGRMHSESRSDPPTKPGFSVNISSKRVSAEAARSLKHVLHIHPKVYSHFAAADAVRPTNAVHISSANLARLLPNISADPISHIPNSKKARIAFARAVFDLGSCQIKTKLSKNGGKVRRHKAVQLRLGNAQALSTTSKILSENGVPHDWNRRLNQIRVPDSGVDQFLKTIGLRDLMKSARLLSR